MRVETNENSFERSIKLFNFTEIDANIYFDGILKIYPPQAYGTTMVKKSDIYYLITMAKSSD
jgi:hypothetical protein